MNTRVDCIARRQVMMSGYTMASSPEASKDESDGSDNADDAEDDNDGSRNDDEMFT